MALSHVDYSLENWFIHSWLAAGPQAVEIPAPTGSDIDAYRREAAGRFFVEQSQIEKTPVERGPVTEGILKIGEFETTWQYSSCGDDHFVHRSTFAQTWQFQRAWAYTQIMSEAAQDVQLTVSTTGPVDVWINGRPAFHSDSFANMYVQDQAFEARFREGKNEVVVRFANVCSGACPLVMSLQVSQASAALTARIPTLMKSVSRRNELEPVLNAAFADLDVFGWNQLVQMQWPVDMRSGNMANARLQTTNGRIFGETEANGNPGEKVGYTYAHQLNDGEYQYLLMPRGWEYYESDIRLTKTINFQVVGNAAFTTEPYGDFEQRKVDLLRYASRQGDDSSRTIARMMMGRWAEIEQKQIDHAFEEIKRQTDDSVLSLANLLGARVRFESADGFPQGLRQPLDEAAAAFLYAAGPASESRRLMHAAAEILAGQLYPKTVFASGMTGQQHREHGEQAALELMQSIGTTGYSDWNSPAALADLAAAYALMVEHAEHEQVWDLASVLLDKLFFAIALHSYQGSYGAPHRNAEAWSIRSGLTKETAGISRLMWGMGVYNQNLTAPIALAMMEKYDLAPIFQQIATSNAELWSIERHAGADGDANIATFRTADGMLASVQDYRAGQPGRSEHIWQATLGTGAVVFTNHPAFSRDGDNLQPGFWVGNRVLPRTAQWKNTLVSLYNLPEDDRLGYTHAYFPTASFDESVVREGWAFARKNDGYIALTSSQALDQTRSGEYAFRELRSVGSTTAWICQLGSAAEDGDFAEFQEKVLAQKVSFHGLNVSMETLRGDTLAFGWEGDFVVNGQNQPTTGFPHYESPICNAPFPCSTMEIRSDDYLLTLDFGAEPEN